MLCLCRATTCSHLYSMFLDYVWYMWKLLCIFRKFTIFTYFLSTLERIHRVLLSLHAIYIAMLHIQHDFDHSNSNRNIWIQLDLPFSHTFILKHMHRKVYLKAMVIVSFSFEARLDSFKSSISSWISLKSRHQATECVVRILCVTTVEKFPFICILIQCEKSNKHTHILNKFTVLLHLASV